MGSSLDLDAYLARIGERSPFTPTLEVLRSHFDLCERAESLGLQAA